MVYYQLVRGNPGTSYLACLMCMYDDIHRFSEMDQLEIFCSGVRKPSRTFWTGAVSDFCRLYDLSLIAITDSKSYFNIIRRETDSLKSICALFTPDVWRYLESRLGIRGIVISVDLYEINHQYHDFHFVWLRKLSDKYSIFDPLSGKILVVSKKRAKQICQSTVNNLNDVTIAFMDDS